MSTNALFLSAFSDIAMTATSALDALEAIANLGYKSGLVKDSWLAAVLAREQDFPTGLPTPIPVAIPHTDSTHVIGDGIGFFRLVDPVNFGEMGSLGTQLPVRIIIPLLITDPKQQVPLLVSVINFLQDENFVKKLLDSSSNTEIEALLNSKIRDTPVLD